MINRWEHGLESLYLGLIDPIQDPENKELWYNNHVRRPQSRPPRARIDQAKPPREAKPPRAQERQYEALSIVAEIEGE
jgi:hypothetical protein